MTRSRRPEVIEEARSLARSHDYDRALKLLDTLSDEDPDDPEVWRSRAYVFDHKGDPLSAAVEISRAIALQDREPDLFFTRARYYMMSDRFREAVGDLTTTLALCDDYQSDYYREAAHLLRAYCHVRLSMADAALEDCVKVRDDAVMGGVGRLVSKQEILRLCHELSGKP
jgi:tetratricopeptide (TPR) repeat protein